MPVIPSTLYVANSTNPYADQSYQSGDRPASGLGLAKYSSQVVEIIQPQAALDTKNRFYKQYPGIEYNVKVAVIGGDFSALAYSLTTSPSGMSINASTGEITWANPVTLGSPHSVTAQVTDGLSTDTVSWTITVTTTGFIFVDSTTGTSGVGTIGDPLKTWLDVYLTNASDNTYADDFLIFRAGTYILDAPVKNAGHNGSQWTINKPLVMMSYPGEAVTQDFSLTFFHGTSAISNFYFDDMTVSNVGDHVVGSGEGDWAARLFGDNITFRRCNFTDIADYTGSWNQAYVMAPRAGGSVYSNNWNFSENQFNGSAANAYAVCVTYDTIKVIIESNDISNSGNIGIGIKSGNSKCFMRGNKAAGQDRLFDVYNAGWPEDENDGNHEVSWNFGNSSAGYSFHYNGQRDLAEWSTYIFRNTFLDSLDYIEVLTLNPIIYETDNVIVSAETYGHVTTYGIDESRITKVGSLINSVETSFVSPTTGLLIDSYASQNATKGHNSLAGLK